MKVLIVGAGIAGPTLACWLLQAGHEPTLAERMGIAGELRRLGYGFAEARAVGIDGRRLGSLETSGFLGSGDRYVRIARSDLAAAIFDALGGGVELVLATPFARSRITVIESVSVSSVASSVISIWWWVRTASIPKCAG